MNKLAAAFVAVLALMPLAFAVDLGDYPTFLFEDHNLNAYVVVGADAKPSDVVGAVDLAVRLAGESYEEVTTTGGVSLAGAVSEEIPLGEVIAGGAKLDTTLKHYKLSGLKDDTIDFQDETYDFHEEIQLTSTSDNLDVETSLTTGDDDYESNVYLEIARDAIKYCYVFDENINISTATQDEPLEIEFLGKTLKVTDVTDSDTFTIQVGEEYTLSPDESVTVAGKTVTLKNVGSGGTVLVDVDGVTATIAQDTTKTVNGIKIRPIEYFYSDEKSERMATLIIGEETTKTYNDGDAYIGEDEDNPNWVWDLAGLTSNSPTLCVENDFVKDDYSDNPAGVGECYTLPNDYAKVCLDSLTVDTYQTYEFKTETGVDLSDAGRSTSAKVLMITSPGEDEGLQITSNVNSNTPKTDTIYVFVNSTSNNGKLDIFYIDADGDVTLAGQVTLSGSDTSFTNIAQVNFQDTKGGDMYIAVAGNLTKNSYFYMLINNTVVSGDNIKMKWSLTSGAVTHLGSTADDSESDELQWGSTPTSIGTKDVDLRTKYGTVIKDPDTNGASDKVVLEIPADQVKAKVIVYGPGAEVTTTTGETIKKVVPITTPVAKLDTEIADPATVGKDLILVGGPAVNRLTAQAMGYEYPTYGADITEISEGEGFIGYYPDVFATGQDVVVVFGWEAEQTRVACAALQQYADFLDDFAGHTKVKVTGTITAPVITPIE